MIIPRNKTKIVCTIGPASATPEIMANLIGKPVITPTQMLESMTNNRMEIIDLSRR